MNCYNYKYTLAMSLKRKENALDQDEQNSNKKQRSIHINSLDQALERIWHYFENDNKPMLYSLLNIVNRLGITLGKWRIVDAADKFLIEFIAIERAEFVELLEMAGAADDVFEIAMLVLESYHRGSVAFRQPDLTLPAGRVHEIKLLVDLLCDRLRTSANRLAAIAEIESAATVLAQAAAIKKAIDDFFTVCQQPDYAPILLVR